MTIRAYDPDRDRAPLWRCKRAFELELGGDDAEKRAAYEAKLDDEYRREYLAWVERCVAEDPGLVAVADAGGHLSGKADDLPDGGNRPDVTDRFAGYAFVLPERLAYVWDAAVLNEIYVDPAARATGLADDLLERALAVARDQDLPMDRIVLDVDPDNERARSFYRRHGFEPWGEMVARRL